MSVSVDLSERQLGVVVVKMAAVLALLFVLVAVAATLLSGVSQDTAFRVFFISFSFTILANGVLAVLKIVDWFEARKHRHG